VRALATWLLTLGLNRRAERTITHPYPTRAIGPIAQQRPSLIERPPAAPLGAGRTPQHRAGAATAGANAPND